MTDPAYIPAYPRSLFTAMPSGRLVAELSDLPQWQRIPDAIAVDGTVFRRADTFRDSEGYVVSWLFVSRPSERLVIFSEDA